MSAKNAQPATVAVGPLASALDARSTRRQNLIAASQNLAQLLVDRLERGDAAVVEDDVFEVDKVVWPVARQGESERWSLSPAKALIVHPVGVDGFGRVLNDPRTPISYSHGAVVREPFGNQLGRAYGRIEANLVVGVWEAQILFLERLPHLLPALEDALAVEAADLERIQKSVVALCEKMSGDGTAECLAREDPPLDWPESEQLAHYRPRGSR